MNTTRDSDGDEDPEVAVLPGDQQFYDAYGLTHPVRILTPAWPRPGARREPSPALTLTSAHSNQTITLTAYPHDGVITISVPCDQTPHCNTCECETQHTITLTTQNTQQLANWITNNTPQP